MRPVTDIESGVVTLEEMRQEPATAAVSADGDGTRDGSAPRGMKRAISPSLVTSDERGALVVRGGFERDAQGNDPRSSALAQLDRLQRANASVKAEATAVVQSLVTERDDALGRARDASTRAHEMSERGRHEAEALRRAANSELQRMHEEKQRAQANAALLADELEDAHELVNNLVKSENAKMSEIDDLTQGRHSRE